VSVSTNQSHRVSRATFTKNQTPSLVEHEYQPPIHRTHPKSENMCKGVQQQQPHRGDQAVRQRLRGRGRRGAKLQGQELERPADRRGVHEEGEWMIGGRPMGARWRSHGQGSRGGVNSICCQG